MSYNSNDPQNTLLNDRLKSDRPRGGLAALEQDRQRIQMLEDRRQDAMEAASKAKEDIQRIKAAAMATWNQKPESEDNK